ncbi:MAG: PAS domain-containing protein [Deltaproteobacteria bacterium]|nr:PAS domain-containing protein [Deltaproteobacteria bacterium]
MGVREEIRSGERKGAAGRGERARPGAAALRQLALGSIRRAFLILPLFLIIPLLAFQVWVFSRWVEHEKADEARLNQEVARSLAADFEGYVDRIVQEERLIGSLLIAYGEGARAGADLLRKVELPAVRLLLWADPTGRILDSDPAVQRAFALPEGAYLAALKAGRQWAVSDLLASPADGRPRFLVAGGVRGPGGDLAGIVAAVVDPALLGPVLGRGAHTGSDLALLDGRGRVAFRHPPGRPGEPGGLGPAFPQLAEALRSGREVSFVARSRPDSERRVFTAVPLSAPGWAVLADRPLMHSAYAAEREIHSGVAVLFFLAAGCFLLAYFYRKAISQPLARLEEYAAALGQAELRARLEDEAAPRELRRVTEALNRMAERLEGRELERARVEEELRLGETRLRVSNAAAALGTWDWDIAGGQLSWDAKSKELVGLEPETEPSFDLFMSRMHPDDRDRVQRAVERCLDTLEDYESEYRTVLPGGEVRWILARGRALADEAGRPIRMVGVALDVTRRKEYEATLARAQEAEVLDRAKSEFMAVASHELHTPLNSVIGYAEILRDEIDGPLNPEQRASVERIIAGGHRLVSLADAILDLSRMETAGVSLASAGFQVREAIREAVSAYEDQAHRKGLTFACSFAPDVPEELRGDGDRLVQALRVLLDNAVKFTEAGEIAVEVARHSALGRRECLRFTVTDTGAGIPREAQIAIFRPFERAETHATRAHGGLGLGLPICRGLVEKMGGQLWVESEPGRGSAFTFTACFEVP